MRGQWLGRLTGTTDGAAIIDVDEVRGGYSGHALFFPDARDEPGTVVEFATHTKGGPHRFENLDVAPLDRIGGIIPKGKLAEVFPGTFHADRINVTLNETDRGLEVAFDGVAEPAGGRQEPVTGAGVLVRPSADAPSEALVLHDVCDWASFKALAIREPYSSFIYRGQPCQNRLRTSFHRHGRSDLIRYSREDVPHVHRRLTPMLSHLFNLADPEQVGAFYSLIQHHGYPTPLLDWTYSPFIAAFFAYRYAQPSDNPNAMVRVYMFNHLTWRRHVGGYPRVSLVEPHFTVVELLGVSNPRMNPQQALSTVTNLDDIEGFIIHHERRLCAPILSAIDLPLSERPHVLRELSLMGITSASLFPGLDGACEAMKMEKFGY